jgi:hypothetical protein
MWTSHPCKDRKDTVPRNSTSAKVPNPNFKNRSKHGPPALYEEQLEETVAVK